MAGTARLAVDFLRALERRSQRLARENAAVTKKALGKFTRADERCGITRQLRVLQGRVLHELSGAVEKSMANALKFVEHPKAKGADVKQFYDNSLVEEAMK